MAPDSFIRGLERHGFRYLGQGRFARVMGRRDQPRCVKICTDLDGMPDGWSDYMAWAAGAASPYAPRAHSMRTLPRADTGKLHGRWSATVLDRYAMTTANVDHLCSKPEAARRRDVHALAQIALEDADEDAAVIRSLAREEQLLGTPGLTAYVRDLRRTFLGLWDFDLDPQNTMWTSSGEFVITDPLSFRTVQRHPHHTPH